MAVLVAFALVAIAPTVVKAAAAVLGVPGLLDTLRSGRPFQQSTARADGPGDDAARHRLQYPLMAGGQLVGLMSLSRRAAGPFDEAELHAAAQLG